ncbi:gliding motility protein GldM [Limibacter armeniacum]|uniref:type IX secretion system motor protein PorM/GldM n=1 Tax=Limibacter armeniacum TaxID=466084 RepID=UPI002FE6ABC2
MAGGAKETPRQKMIGLMYLVLLAMLALQVSNTVLDKFMFIESSFDFSNNITSTANEQVVSKIASVANQKKDNKETAALLDDATAIRNKTKEVISFINEMKSKITEIAGPDIETGELKDKAGYDGQMLYTLGPGDSKSGTAYELKTLLDSYVETLNKIGVSNIEEHKAKTQEIITFNKINKIAKDGSEDTKYTQSNDPSMRENIKKDFAQLQFDHTPNVAALAVLSQLASEVLQAESEVMNVLETRSGAKVNFDKVVPVVKPESKYVAAGTDYKATMFIAASSSSAKPRMTFNESSISVENGEGIVEFKATPGKYDNNGRAKKTWKGTITYTTPFGDTTLNIEEEYYVVKPTIEINSATVNALYRNCANELIVDVPALGESYNPQFSATNASTSNKGKALTIIPSAKAKSVDLTVKSGGSLIGKKTFKTKGIPLPEVEIYADGKKVDLASGISKRTRSVELRVRPDSEFAAALPNEARYRVVKWEVLGARGPRPVGAPQRVSGGTQKVSVSNLAKNSDRLVIEIQSLVRKNSLGNVEGVRMTSNVINVPVTKE